MAKHRNNNGHSRSDMGNEAGRNAPANNLEKRSSVPNDLPDNPRDEEKLQDQEASLDLPDVKDIPGQEFVHAPPLGELADTTISSSDEEGDRVFAADNNSSRNDEGNVSRDERHALERTDAMPTRDEENLQRASMDGTDFDGDELNEKGFGERRGDTVAPDDLDTNVADDDSDADGPDVTDEENKTYSLGSGDNDNLTEGTP